MSASSDAERAPLGRGKREAAGERQRGAPGGAVGVGAHRAANVAHRKQNHRRVLVAPLLAQLAGVRGGIGRARSAETGFGPAAPPDAPTRRPRPTPRGSRGSRGSSERASSVRAASCDVRAPTRRRRRARAGTAFSSPPARTPESRRRLSAGSRPRCASAQAAGRCPRSAAAPASPAAARARGRTRPGSIPARARPPGTPRSGRTCPSPRRTEACPPPARAGGQAPRRSRRLRGRRDGGPGGRSRRRVACFFPNPRRRSPPAFVSGRGAARPPGRADGLRACAESITSSHRSGRSASVSTASTRLRDSS